MAKLKDLKKMARALNKTDFLEDPIDLKGDLDVLTEDFIEGIEEIDDAGKIEKIDEEIIDFYEDLLAEVTDPKEGGKGKGKKKDKDKEKKKQYTADDIEEMKKKDLLQLIEDEDLDIDEDDYPKKKDLVTAIIKEMDLDEEGEGEEDAGSILDMDEDDFREKLEDMSAAELKKFLEAEDIEISSKITKKTFDDAVEEAVEAFLEAQEDAKGKKKGKGKKKDEGKTKLPKGIRAGTLPGALYTAIEDGGANLEELAEIVAEIKDKDPEKMINTALRVVIRKVGASVPITALISGGKEGLVTFELAEED